MKLHFIQQMAIGLACAAVAAGGGGGSARADGLDQFRAEYPKAEAKLEEAYSNLTIQATETVNDIRGEFRVMAICECLREGDLVRGKQTVIRSGNSGFSPGAVMASGGSGDRAFEIFKQNPDGAFRFLFFGTRKKNATYDRYAYSPLFCPYTLLETGVADFIRQKNVTLVSAAPTLWNGHDAVEVVAQLTKPDHAPFVNHFIFQPRTWALVGWVCPLTWTGPPESWRAQITYEPETDPPQVTTIDKWVEGPDPKVKINGQHWEISDFEFGPIDPKEFDISAFGVTPPSHDVTTRPATAP
jgi:hypothetical protein